MKFPKILSACVAASVLALLTLASPAYAAYKVRIEYISTQVSFFSMENVSGSGSTPVHSLGAPSFVVGGVPVSGEVRITAIQGAAVLTVPAASPGTTGGDTKGLRIQVGQPPVTIPITSGQVMQFVEAADAPANSPVGDVNNSSFSAPVVMTAGGSILTTPTRDIDAECTTGGTITVKFANNQNMTWYVQGSASGISNDKPWQATQVVSVTGAVCTVYGMF